MLWRSDATRAVFLRVSLRKQRPAKRVVQIARNSSPAAGSPHDDGDHDPDIDLVTLRRKRPSKLTIPNLSHEAIDTVKPSAGYSGIDAAFSKPPSPTSQNPDSHHTSQAEDSAAHSWSRHVKIQAGRISPTSSDSPISFASIAGNAGSRPHTSVDTLDPYLINYLKSLRSKSSKPPKPTITEPNDLSPQDLDIDSLRPVDVRSIYRQRKSTPGMAPKDSPIASTGTSSGEPGLIPDHLTDANIKTLNLPSSGGKVVIPKALLVRLIEETINLSGAAIRGDDVIIERYSPTWHRFARLLRTSDLHKISSLPQSHHSDCPPRSDNDVFGLDRALETSETIPGTKPQGPIKSGVNSDKVNSRLPAVTEREYIVLALDSKKSRVISTRFSRLLDGPTVTAPVSTEDLLKVEHLNK